MTSEQTTPRVKGQEVGDPGGCGRGGVRLRLSQGWGGLGPRRPPLVGQLNKQLGTRLGFNPNRGLRDAFCARTCDQSHAWRRKCMHTHCWTHIVFLHTNTASPASLHAWLHLPGYWFLRRCPSPFHPRPVSPTSQPASDMQPKGCRIPGMIPYMHDLHFRAYVISQHLLCKSLVKKPERHWLQLLQARQLMRTDERCQDRKFHFFSLC